MHADVGTELECFKHHDFFVSFHVDRTSSLETPLFVMELTSREHDEFAGFYCNVVVAMNECGIRVGVEKGKGYHVVAFEENFVRLRDAANV